MKFYLDNYKGKEIEIGDIIDVMNYGVCLLTYDDSSYHEEYPYKIVDLQSGQTVYSYKDISIIREEHRLLIKNEDLVISNFDCEEDL